MRQISMTQQLSEIRGNPLLPLRWSVWLRKYQIIVIVGASWILNQSSLLILQRSNHSTTLVPHQRITLHYSGFSTWASTERSNRLCSHKVVKTSVPPGLPINCFAVTRCLWRWPTEGSGKHYSHIPFCAGIDVYHLLLKAFFKRSHGHLLISVLEQVYSILFLINAA